MRGAALGFLRLIAVFDDRSMYRVLMFGQETGVFLRVAVELSYIAFFLFKPKEVFIGCRTLSLMYVYICVV